MSKIPATEADRVHLLDFLKEDKSDRAEILRSLLRLTADLDGPFLPRDGKDRSKPSTKPYAIGFESKKNQLELAVDMHNKAVKIWISPKCGELSDLFQFGTASSWKSQSKKGEKSSALKTVAPTLAKDKPAYILEEIRPSQLIDFVKRYCQELKIQDSFFEQKSLLAPSKFLAPETSAPSEDNTSPQQQETEGNGLNSVFSTSAQMKLDTDTPSLTTSERDAVVKVRYGQGEFREALFKEDGERCWMSGIEGRRLLVASHIKPWSHCKDDLESRGQPDNGLLLSSLWDAAFDVGLISFDEDWQVITSAELSLSAKQALSLDQHTALPDKFRKNGRRKFLAYHRAEVFEFWKKVASPKKDQA
ncbi:MAG: HNH endonuclease [Nitrosomonadales bacterium]|nr:HNH endonuclease [Nitrosomonadales bacterium]